MRPREMMKLQVRHGWLHRMVLSAMVVMLTACGSTRVANRAPVEDRGVAAAKVVSNEAVAVAGTGTEAPALKPPLPGAENAGKPGYYTIKPGDTLIRIGLENGQSWRDIVRWNRLDNPNRIEIGQVLRITPAGRYSRGRGRGRGPARRHAERTPAGAAGRPNGQPACRFSRERCRNVCSGTAQTGCAFNRHAGFTAGSRFG